MDPNSTTMQPNPTAGATPVEPAVDQVAQQPVAPAVDPMATQTVNPVPAPQPEPVQEAQAVNPPLNNVPVVETPASETPAPVAMQPEPVQVPTQSPVQPEQPATSVPPATPSV